MGDATGPGKSSDPKRASPPPDAVATLDGTGTLPGLGGTTSTSVGPYRFLKKLGQGGMGQIWLAEQTAPLQRTLKLIRAGLYDEALLQRLSG